MAKGNAPKDLYMQFKDIKVSLHATATQTLMEATVDTGLSIRGGLAWLIHAMHFEPDVLYVGGCGIYAALSSRKGLSVLPDYTEKGMLARIVVDPSGTGDDAVVYPKVVSYLPPVPIAAPNVSLYAKTGIHEAGLANSIVACRICFTTVPLDAALYTEIAETWGW